MEEEILDKMNYPEIKNNNKNMNKNSNNKNNNSNSRYNK